MWDINLAQELGLQKSRLCICVTTKLPFRYKKTIMFLGMSKKVSKETIFMTTVSIFSEFNASISRLLHFFTIFCELFPCTKMSRSQKMIDSKNRGWKKSFPSLQPTNFLANLGLGLYVHHTRGMFLQFDFPLYIFIGNYLVKVNPPPRVRSFNLNAEIKQKAWLQPTFSQIEPCTVIL